MLSGPSPLVVVGAGIAGLSLALSAAPRPVVLVSRGHGGRETASALAQGGVAAALGSDDGPERHARDTIIAGAGHNDAALVAWLAAQAAPAIAWLAAQGVEFDRDGQGWRLGREGGHDRDRIVHAQGDATGRAIVAALARRAAAATHIRWLGGHTLLGLGQQAAGVAGVRLADPQGSPVELPCDDVVFATGGPGALFAATTNPAGADGAGLALALAAGASGRDLEFVQFHPTALARPGDGPLPLLTEALRGAGAVLRDGRGRALMAGRHPMADLAPRDLVARIVWQQRQRDGEAWLDATALGETFARRFPTAMATCRAHGIDPLRQWIPVTPAAHFHMGGVSVDALGRSGVRGLHAVGEVACNGVHGANRLASNSLLEGVVFGRRLGARLARCGRERPRQPSAWTMLGDGAPPDALRALRDLLWRGLGPVRDADGLRDSLARIAAHRSLADAWQGRLATRLLHAALARNEGLGAHHRSDSEPATFHTPANRYAGVRRK